MKKLLFLLLCFTILKVEAEDTLYIYTADSVYTYSVSDIESIGFVGELSVTELEHITNITSFSLFQNYPNPFNPKTNITFELNQSGRASVDIFNMKGQLVKTLLDNHLYGGKHNVVWDGSDVENKQVGSGMYFYRVTVNGQQYSKQMIMLK